MVALGQSRDGLGLLSLIRAREPVACHSIFRSMDVIVNASPWTACKLRRVGKVPRTVQYNLTFVGFRRSYDLPRREQ
jgi:hypothetical protein